MAFNWGPGQAHLAYLAWYYCYVLQSSTAYHLPQAPHSLATCKKHTIKVIHHQDTSGNLPGRYWAGSWEVRQTGGWGRGLGTLCALCSPSLCLFLYSHLILISNTCTQHLESVRYHLEASGSFRRAPDHALRGPVRGTHAGYMRGTSVAVAGPSIPVGSMGAWGRVLSNSDPRTT